MNSFGFVVHHVSLVKIVKGGQQKHNCSTGKSDPTGVLVQNKYADVFFSSGSYSCTAPAYTINNYNNVYFIGIDIGSFIQTQLHKYLHHFDRSRVIFLLRRFFANHFIEYQYRNPGKGRRRCAGNQISYFKFL